MSFICQGLGIEYNSINGIQIITEVVVYYMEIDSGDASDHVRTCNFV